MMRIFEYGLDSPRFGIRFFELQAFPNGFDFRTSQQTVNPPFKRHHLALVHA